MQVNIFQKATHEWVVSVRLGCDEANWDKMLDKVKIKQKYAYINMNFAYERLLTWHFDFYSVTMLDIILKV